MPIARMQAVAETQYLQREWMLDDVQKFAAANERDISIDDGMNAALNEVYNIYDEVRADLHEYGASISAAHDQLAAVEQTTSQTPDVPGLPLTAELDTLITDLREGRSASLSAEQMDQAIDALKTQLSEDQLTAIRAGDGTALEEITGDPKAAAQLHHAMLKYDIAQGHAYDPAVLHRTAQESSAIQTRRSHGEDYGEE